MNRKHRIRDMAVGGVLTALILTMCTPTLAALKSKNIEVFTGLKVYVNDRLVDPRDANGNSVEVLVYDGTTYLPIRAVGNALGLPVQYDGAAQSAYIGTHRSEKPAVYLDELDYFSGDEKITTKLTENDNLNQGHSRCIVTGFERAYKLNGQYSRLTGTMYANYQDRSHKIPGGAGVWIYGDGKLLYGKEIEGITTEFEPVDIDVDLSGVLNLTIRFSSGCNEISDWTYPLSLGEMALYT